MLNFTGTTKHRNINLGGRSLINKNKNSVLLNAQAERLKREKLRLETKATIRIQATVRRLLSNRIVRNQLRENWPLETDDTEQIIRKFCYFFSTSDQDPETSLRILSQLQDVLNSSKLTKIPQTLIKKLLLCLIESIGDATTPELSSISFDIFKQIYHGDVDMDNLNIDLEDLSHTLIKLRSFLNPIDVLYFSEKTPAIFMKELMFNKSIIDFQIDTLCHNNEADKLLNCIIKLCLQMAIDNRPEFRDGSSKEKFNLLDSVLYLIFANPSMASSWVDSTFIGACTVILESIHSGLRFTMDLDSTLDEDDMMDIDSPELQNSVSTKCINVDQESYQRLLLLYSVDSLRQVASKFLNDENLFHLALNYFYSLMRILIPIDETCVTNESLKSSFVAKLIVLSSEYDILHGLYKKLEESPFFNEITVSIDQEDTEISVNGKLWDLAFCETSGSWWRSFYLFQELYSYLLYVSNDTNVYQKGKLSESEFLSFTLFLKNFSVFVVIAGRKMHSKLSEKISETAKGEKFAYLHKIFPIVGRFSIRLLKQIYLRNLKFQRIADDFWLLKSVKFEPNQITTILSEFPNSEEDTPLNSPLFDLFPEIDSVASPVKPVTQSQAKTALILIHLPFMISFELRAEVFHLLIRIDKATLPYSFRGLEGSVSRDNLLGDAFNEFSTASSTQFKGPLSVSFSNKFGIEAGIDGGGLTKEFLTSAVSQGFSVSLRKDGPINIASQLFQTTSQNYQLYPSPHMFWSHKFQQYLNKLYNREVVVFSEEEEKFDLEMLRFLGMIIGKCLYDNVLIDVSFAPFFLSKWSGGIGSISDRLMKSQKPQQYRNSLHDLKDFDAELYQNLNKLLELSEEELKNLDLTFTLNEKIIDYNNSDVFKSVVKQRGSDVFSIDLILDGSNISVDTSNRLQYIYSIAKFKLDHSVSIQSHHFLEGLFKIISPNWLSLFNPLEIQTLVSGGEKEIDIDDLQKNVEISGYSDSSPTIVYLFDILRNDFTSEEKSKFVKFVTSSSKAPLLGFKELKPSFAIRNSGSDISRLPTAGTCMNLLKLPNYDSRQILKEKLLYAINSEAGFDLS